MPGNDPTTTTDILQTVFIGLQLLVLAVAAVYGRRQLKEAKELREAHTRPFVTIDLGSSAHTLFDLVVKNIGPTLARDVHFEFDPPIKSTDEELDPNKLKMFREGIHRWRPARKYERFLREDLLVTSPTSPTHTRSPLPIPTRRANGHTKRRLTSTSVFIGTASRSAVAISMIFTSNLR